MKTFPRRLSLQFLEARDVPASGDLDVKFSGDGLLAVAANEGGSNADVVLDAVVLGNGKSLVLSSSSTPSGTNWFVSRFNKDGSPDTGFGDTVDGVRTGRSRIAEQTVFSRIAAQGSKIVVAGSSDLGGGNEDVYAIRLDKFGALDQTFGDEGFANVPLNLVQNGDDVLNGIAVKRKRIALAITSDGVDGDSDAVVAMLDKNGSADDTFGQPLEGGNLKSGRFVLGSIPEAPFNVSMAAVAFQGSKVVFAGTATGVTNSRDMIVGRLTKSGADDSSFGGEALTRLIQVNLGGANDDGATGLAVQGSKILVAGISDSDTGPVGVVVRIDKAGLNDESFGDGGVVGFEGLVDVRVAAKGSNVHIAGTDVRSSNSDLFLAKIDKKNERVYENVLEFPTYENSDTLAAMSLVGGRVTLFGTITAGGADTDLGIARFIA